MAVLLTIRNAPKHRKSAQPETPRKQEWYTQDIKKDVGASQSCEGEHDMAHFESPELASIHVTGWAIFHRTTR